MNHNPTDNGSIQDRLAALRPFLRSYADSGEEVKTAESLSKASDTHSDAIKHMLPSVGASNFHQGTEKTASVLVPRNTLLKSASLIRNLQQSAANLQDELDSQSKELEAYKTASALLVEGIIDPDDLEEKIAELKAHPEKGNFFLDIPKTEGFGELQKKASLEASDPLTEFLLSTGEI